MTYTIDNRTNLITAHLTAENAAATSTTETFDSEAELGELAASWPRSRLIEIWNALPAVVPVKKFKDRATGVARVWKAIRQVEEPATGAKLEAPAAQAMAVPEPAATKEVVEIPEPVAESTDQPEPTTTPEGAQAPDVAPEEAPATPKPTSAKKATQVPKEPKPSHQESKKAKVLDLVQRERGATLVELMEATGWQAHSVRGFISGTLTKKMGLAVVSAKSEDGVRHYSIKA